MADNEGGPADGPGPNESEPDDAASRPKLVTRRAALAVLGVGVAGGTSLVAGRRIFFNNTSSDRAAAPAAPPREVDPATTTTAAPTTTAAAAPGMALWSDPASWGGAVPGEGDVATVKQPVMLDVDAKVAGVEIEAAGELVFDPTKSHTLTSSANVVVHGALRMRPGAADVHQVISIVGVDEGRYVGGETEVPQDTDVGVWVLHSGVVDLLGAEKTAWTHLGTAAEAGATTIAVDAADGWQVGDEIVVTATEAPHENSEHFMHFDRRVIAAVDGKSITLEQPLEHGHPNVTVREGVTHRAEVLNLTRNVRIEGTPEGKSHITILHGQVPQKVGWVGLRHVGPKEVLGRYAFHFHMGNDAVRGSTVDGLVAYDSANHAFVPHLSNGVTYRDCIVHDSADHAYWWDPAGDGQQAGDVPSHDIVWERCVASSVAAGRDAHATTSFMMGAGRGNACKGCVATGGSGASEGATGFRWGSGSNDETNTWVFEDNVTHNNSHSGLFFWQNNAPRTIIDRHTIYHCGQGIYAGSYINLVSYRDCVVYGCSDWGLIIAATPMQGLTSPDETVTYENMYVDQLGAGEYAVYVEGHQLTGDHVTMITNGTFKGARKAAVGFPDGGEIRQMYDFVDCTFEGNAFWFGEGVPVDSQIRVRGGNLGSLDVHPPGGPGERRAEWNGSATSV